MKSKKLLSVLLATMLLLSCIPLGAVSVSAAAYEDWYYEIDNGEVTVWFYDQSVSGELVIPDTIEGYPVTAIGNYAFEYCYDLTSVIIGDSVTTIGEYAFAECESLTEVNIPDSVTTIGNYAFRDCTSLTAVHISDVAAWCGIAFGNSYSTPLRYAQNLYLNETLVTDLVIPESVTAIGGRAFYGCPNLTSVTIPDSVTNIGGRAFYGCPNLTSVTIPDSVTSIGDYAFSSCISLTSVTIGDSVTTIGDYAFSSCTSLASVTIGDSVTTIGFNAFYYCESLTEVTIPDSVITIGDEAFYSCTSLISVTIGNSVTTIGSSAFDYCTNLTAVTIGNSVTTIEACAFCYCESLTDVYYGGSECDKANIAIGNENRPFRKATWHYAAAPIFDQVDHSVMDTDSGNGLAFRFELVAHGVVKNDYNIMKLTDATINYPDNDCKLVGMGAVVTNSDAAAENLTLDAVNDYNVIDIPTVFLMEADANSCAFAARVIDIPDSQLERTIYARPYYVVEVDGEQVTVYGDVNAASCAEYM